MNITLVKASYMARLKFRMGGDYKVIGQRSWKDSLLFRAFNAISIPH